MKIISKEKIQNVGIGCFLLLGLYFTIKQDYVGGYQRFNGWVMGDWLINYQGGFVRRGLLGEGVFRLAGFSGYNPGLLVLWLHSFLYSVYFLFAYLSLLQQKSLRLYWLLIFSPFIFYFQVFDGQGGYRKEIIFFALLAFLVWVANKWKTEAVEGIFVVVLLLYPLVILTHEMLAVFLPYLLIVYCYRIPLTLKRSAYLIPLLSLSVGAFVVTLKYHGDHTVVQAIQHSLQAAGYTPGYGAIDWIDKSVADARERLALYLSHYNYYKIYFVTAVLTVLPFIPVFPLVKKILKQKINLLLFVVIIAGTVVLFVTTFDWGRLIYINAVAIFLISLLVTDNEQESGAFASLPFILLLALINFSIWHIPHCCGVHPVIKDVDQTNIEVFIRSIRAL